MNTKFNNDVDFSSANFNREANFIGGKFNGIAIFIDSRFRGNTEFYAANFNQGLALINITFTTFRIDWDSLKNGLMCDRPTYLALIKNFKDLGDFGAADNVYYQYRRWDQDQKSWLDLSKYIDIISWLSCGYGIRILHTILSGIFVCGLFGFLYLFMVNRRIRNSKADLIELFWFSAVVLFSIPGELYPQKTEIYKSYANQIKYQLIIFERLIGWALLILFINTMSRLMIRY